MPFQHLLSDEPWEFPVLFNLEGFLSFLHSAIFSSSQEMVAYRPPALDLETYWALLTVEALLTMEAKGAVWPLGPVLKLCPLLTFSQGPPSSLLTSVSLFTGLTLVSRFQKQPLT